MNSLNTAEKQRLNDRSIIDTRDLWFSRLEHLFNGTHDEWLDKYVFTLAGSVPRPANGDLAYTNPEEWVLECLKLIAGQDVCRENRFAPECVEYPIYGVHYIDKMFGANVYYYEGQWNADYLKSEIGELRFPDLDKDETWQLSKRAANAFLEADVSCPLFGLPTLSSPLNIIVNLYGAEALVAMLDEEKIDAVRHDLDVIGELISTLHKWYIDNIPAKQLQPVISWARTQPFGFGQLCGCTSQLLSGKTYSDFIAPLDDSILGVYPNGGMIHLCGGHLQHVETFRDMKNLRSLQLNDRAAGDFEGYFKGMRDDQVFYINPCNEMSAERAIEISGGERLVLVAGGNAPLKPQK